MLYKKIMNDIVDLQKLWLEIEMKPHEVSSSYVRLMCRLCLLDILKI